MLPGEVGAHLPSAAAPRGKGFQMPRVRQGIREELRPELASEKPHGGEALPVLDMREVLQGQVNAHQARASAHWGEALQVP